MLSYLTGEYGKCGFIITRDKGIELSKDKEVKWVKELYDKHNGVLIVKLTGSFFASLLSKLRNPQRHDEANVRLNKILDTYTRLYLGWTGSNAQRWGEAQAPREELMSRA